jgi:hypothetical protein
MKLQKRLSKEMIKKDKSLVHLLDMEQHFFHYRPTIQSDAIDPVTGKQFKSNKLERINIFLYQIYRATIIKTRLNGKCGVRYVYTYLSNKEREILLSNYKLTNEAITYLVDNDYLIVTDSDNSSKYNKNKKYKEYMLTEKSYDIISKHEETEGLMLPINPMVFKSLLKFQARVYSSWLVFAFNEQQDMYFDCTCEQFMIEWEAEGRYEEWVDKCTVEGKDDTTYETFIANGTEQWEYIDKYNKATIQERATTWSCCKFGERTHSIFTRIITFARKFITDSKGRLDDSVHIDLSQSQPTMIAQAIYTEIGPNKFTSYINEGNRIYDMFGGNKGKFLECIFGRYTQDIISDSFGDKVRDVINALKYNSKYTPKHNTQKLQPSVNENGTTIKNKHKQLAMNLQRLESKMFREIAHTLKSEIKDIVFTQVHDCFIVPRKYQFEARAICLKIAKKYLPDVNVEFKVEISNAM